MRLLISLQLFVLLTINIKAQQSSTLFLMHDLPQSNLINPALQIPCKLYIGMPLLNSLHINYSNTYFSYNNLLSISGNDLNANINYLANNTSKTNLITFETDINLLSFGYKYKKYYFTFNLTERVGIQQNMPGEIFNFMVYGNTQFVGSTANLSGIKINGTWYREWALGASKEVNQQLLIGARAKLLFGKANLRTTQSDFKVTTGVLPYELGVNTAFTLNTSGPFNLTQNADGTISGINDNLTDPVAVILNSENKGAAFDFGVVYKLNNEITLSGSLLDLGLIYWQTNATNLTENGNIRYNGLSANGNNVGLIENSINSFVFNVSNNAYFTATNPKMYLGGTYKINNWLNAGMVSRSELYPDYWHQSFTASGNASVYNRLAASVSWSYLNNTFANIGTGIGMRTPNWGWYAVSDNTLGYFKYKTARTINLRIGFYAMFGCSKQVSTAIPPFRGCHYMRDEQAKQNRIKAIIDRLKKNKKRK